ncbi:MAG TPA: hypothetical protein VGC99_28560 [Candidatus Tectomicrobia bacterium]
MSVETPFSGPRGGTRRRASMAAASRTRQTKAGLWSAAPAQEAEILRRSPPRVDGPALRVAVLLSPSSRWLSDLVICRLESQHRSGLKENLPSGRKSSGCKLRDLQQGGKGRIFDLVVEKLGQPKSKRCDYAEQMA